MKNDENGFYPAALTIAGSDSGGGAGIQADLRTFAAFGVFGCSAITAITAQNPRAVLRVDAVPAAGVAAQLQAVMAAIAIRWAKTGMLLNAEIIAATAENLQQTGIGLIVDPVMVSTSGARLLETAAVAAMKEKLLPLADWVTPNIPEAELLLDTEINNRETAIKAAQEFSERYHCNLILKAGHFEEQNDTAADIVRYEGKTYELSSPRLPGSKAAHGTGCTLSAALTAALALGINWKKALRMAKGFVYGSLNEAVNVGAGIEAMYPPLESYQGQTLLERID
ncbi:MAG: bifunctional hydroxymethylpyrimidine kinase/phosphomethylpyrimidine kinase [Victivallales bacterium]|nr:bifunctional hydroxymethylpyrimidine kinase/phosphomethylpyrimidine kinase [Victivallales bacterium]